MIYLNYKYKMSLLLVSTENKKIEVSFEEIKCFKFITAMLNIEDDDENTNYELNEDLLKKIKIQIRKNASPRHVPSKIIVIDDIPRTKNGKIVELAVKNTIEGNEIKNKEALANPRVLDQYKNLKELNY